MRLAFTSLTAVAVRTFPSARIRRTLLVAVLSLAALPLLQAAASGGPQPDCVLATVGVPSAGNPPLEPRMVKVTFTNTCGKDITAVGFRFEGPGVKPWSDSADRLMALADAPDVYYSEESGGPPMHQDILRDGQSVSHRHSVRGDAPFYTATVTCVLFLDHTSVGDAAAIAAIQRDRREIYLPAYQESVDILGQLQALDYKDGGRQLLEGRIKAKRTNAPWLGVLAFWFPREDEPSWRKRVQAQLDHDKKVVQLLREQSAGQEQGK